MSLVQNERVKLTAGLLNTVAGFSITAGGVGPLIALSYGLGGPTALGPTALGVVAALWLGIGGGLHIFAPHLLRRLE